MSNLSGQEDTPAPEDEEREFLLLPGVTATTVTSGFSDVKLNRLCKIVLRLAFYFFLFQISVMIIDFSLLMSKGEEGTAAIGLIRVLGVAATLYLAYTGIAYKNQEWLCGLTFLHAYQIIMYLMLLFSGLEVVLVVLLLATTKVFYVYQFILTSIHISFEVSSLVYISAIFKLIPNLPTDVPNSSTDDNL
jgi:hypothetical protein